MTEATQRAEYNIINWKNHQETEEELRIYAIEDDDDDEVSHQGRTNNKDINSHLAANAPGPRVIINQTEEERKGV